MVIKQALCFLLCIATAYAVYPVIISSLETGRDTYNSDCSYGPYHGCKNISAAHDCGMMAYCVSHVWSKWNLPKDNSHVCRWCKEVVRNAAKYQMQNNEIKLLYFLNPQVVCAAAGQCNLNWIDNQQVMHSECQQCHSYMSDLHNYFKESPKSILLEHALKACEYSNSFSTVCKRLVINNFKELYDFLKNHLTEVDDTCTFFDMCHQVFPHRKITEGNTMCDFCQTAVNHWVDVVTVRTTEEDLRQVTHALCYTTGGYKKLCMNIVKNYFGEIYNFVVHELNVKEVCTVFGLCQDISTFYQEHLLPLLPLGFDEKVKRILVEEGLKPVTENTLNRNMLEKLEMNIDQPELTEQDEMNHIHLNEIPSAGRESSYPSFTTEPPRAAKTMKENAYNNEFQIYPVPHNNEAFQEKELFENFLAGLKESDPSRHDCATCEMILPDIQHFATNDYNEDEMKDMFDFVCSFKENRRHECQEFIHTYGADIINLLHHKANPSKVCSLLRICPKKNVLTKPVIRCDVCKFIINELNDYLADNATKEEIRDTLNELCSYLPETLTDQCHHLVNEYEETIIEAILATMNSDEVCAYLQLCKPSPTHGIDGEWEKTQTEDMEKVGSPQCVICEFAMNELSKVIEDKKTDEEIIDAVKNLCHYLPKSIASDCKNFITTYGDAIIQIIIDETKDPEEVCIELKLCTGSTNAIENLNVHRCDSCTMIVGYLDLMLLLNPTEERIDRYMRRVCEIVPPIYAQQCKEIVQAYGPYFLGLLEEFDDPHNVCKAVSLCNKHPGQINLLGGKKCILGPSYWCISPFHAKSCQETEYCKAHVWKKT